MESISNLTKDKLKNIKMVVFDVDGVIVPRGTRIKQINDVTKFKIKKVSEKTVNLIRLLNKRGYKININSGRGLFLLQYMFREILPYVSLTYENGSATWFKGEIYQHVNSFDSLNEVYNKLSKIKNNSIKGFEPKEFIITIHCKKRVLEIEKIVSKYKDLYFIWNSEAYDIGIKDVQIKSRGLKKFSEIMKIKKENIIAIGDNYNDIDLLAYSGIKVSADKDRLDGDFYIPINNKKLPAEVLIEWMLKLQNSKSL